MKLLKTVLRYFLYLAMLLLFALIIRVFTCNFYIIPSDSMMPTLLPGDFIMAEKLTYGARVFTSLKFDRNSDPPMMRVPGLGSIQRNDAVVFNHPYRYRDTIRINLKKVFVKRCIGLPGDSLSVVDGFYRIAGLADAVGYIPEQKRLANYNGDFHPSIERVFPRDTTFKWNIRNYGPLFIPGIGDTIPLTETNYKLYHRLMVYETGAVIHATDSAVYINDTLTTHYTFRSNWYFMAGDQVMNSQDSRYTGLIPEAYIIGKASLILTSKDLYSGKRRWNRFFKKI